MDINSLTNILLLVCICIFIAAASYRIGSGRRRAGADENEAASETVEVREGWRERPGPPQAVGREHGDALGGVQLLTRVAQQDQASIRATARTMVDYALTRGGVSHIRPEVLERIATQFGTLEAALRVASYGPTGEPAIISDEVLAEIFREGFRLIASEARK